MSRAPTRPVRPRLRLEALEDRSVPALITEFSAGITPNSGLEEIATGPDGNLWVPEFSSNKIARITPDGAVTEFSSGLSSNAGLVGITGGPDGNVWFTESSTAVNKIGRITPDGTITEFGTGISANAILLGITTGPDGNVWFTERDGNRVGRITPAGTVTQFSTGITASSQPFDIAPGSDGNLWFTERTVDKVGRITPAGTVTEFGTGITANSDPQGITLGPDGNVWFVEKLSSKIARVTTAGVVTEFSLPIAGSQPINITAGSDGALWFVENAGNRIGRITTSGVITEFTIPTANSAPVGIATGPDGNIWFTEIQGNKIGRINVLPVEGAPMSVAAGQTFSGVVATMTPFAPTIRSIDMQAEIDWGDGTVTGGVITGNAQSGFRITGSHTYDTFGTYTATVRVDSFVTPVLGLPAPSTTAEVTVEVHNLQDPSFETPSVGFGNFAYAPAGSPWAFVGPAGLAGNNSAATSSNPPAPQGGQVLFLQDLGAAGQVFTLPAGTYAVSLLAAQRGSFNTSKQTFQVWVDGAPLSTFIPGGVGYTRLTSNAFTVQGGFHMISLVGTNPNGGDNTALVDNVAVVVLSGVADPSFELPALAAGSFAYAPAGSAWEFSGGAGYAANGSGFTSSNPAAPHGTQVLFLQQTGKATQTIDFAAGTYQISFRAAQRGSFNAHDQTFQVLVDGTAVGTFNKLTGTAYALQTTGPITVAAGTHTVQFKGTNLNGGDCTVLIDQLSVNVATLTVNGAGFEAPALAAGTFATAPAGSPWTFAGSAGIASNGSPFTSSNPPAPQGVQVAFLQNTGSFQQSVTLSAGTYAVDFFAAQRGSFNTSAQTFRVLVDGVEVGRFTPGGAAYSFQATSTFAVAAGAHTLRFEGLNPTGGDNTALIDDVFLQLVG
jgi:streptogramin lyase